MSSRCIPCGGWRGRGHEGSHPSGIRFANPRAAPGDCAWVSEKEPFKTGPASAGTVCVPEGMKSCEELDSMQQRCGRVPHSRDGCHCGARVALTSSDGRRSQLVG